MNKKEMGNIPKQTDKPVKPGDAKYTNTRLSLQARNVTFVRLQYFR